MYVFNYAIELEILEKKWLSFQLNYMIGNETWVENKYG